MSGGMPVNGEIYRHFKGKLYQIVAIAKHTETFEDLVIYQALYDDFSIYARPLSMFISEVDREKYPEVRQKYRFEKVEKAELRQEEVPAKKSADISDSNPAPESIQNSVEDEESCNPDLMLFLEAETVKEKRNILIGMKKRIDDRLISDIAASLDIVIEDGDIEERFKSLLSCLDTMSKFECTRLR